MPCAAASNSSTYKASYERAKRTAKPHPYPPKTSKATHQGRLAVIHKIREIR